MGRRGLYYRATLPASSRSSVASGRPPQPVAPQVPANTHAPLEEIESANVLQIVDSSSRELLNELNQKQGKVRLWPIVVVVSGIVLVVGVASSWPAWLLALLILGGFAGTYIARTRDALVKTVVLFYDFDSEMESAYGHLHRAASELASCAAIWHIEASGKVYDRKYHAGASNLVRRKNTFIRKAEPPYLKTNIETVAIGVGRQALHFFPDRVLVYDKNGVGAVGYQDLRIGIGTTRFVEGEAVPRDAKVVDRTWKYVNKSGGPDRRFKDNRELPVCLYEEITLSSQTGLNELLQVSRCGFGSAFGDAIALLGEKMPKESGAMAISKDKSSAHEKARNYVFHTVLKDEESQNIRGDIGAKSGPSEERGEKATESGPPGEHSPEAAAPAAALYDLVLTGQIMPGEDLEAVKQRLAKLLRVDTAWVENLLSQVPAVVKKDLTPEDANRYQTALVRKTGAVAVLRPHAGVSDSRLREEGPSARRRPRSLAERRRNRRDGIALGTFGACGA